MGNLQIILIVFGSSGTIIIILIVVFKWLGIHVEHCWKNRKNKYLAEDLDSSDKSEDSRKGGNNKQLAENQIWNSSRAISFVSTNTIDTFDNIPDICDISSDSLVTQARPSLRRTSVCSDDAIIENLNDDVNCNIDEGIGKLEIELNYNAFEQKLEFSIFQVKDLVLDKNQQDKYNDKNPFINNKPNAYLLVWLNNDLDTQQKSTIAALSNIIVYGAKFKWLINDTLLMHIKINVSLYRIDNLGEDDVLIGETSIFTGDIYMYQPILLWINIFPPNMKPKYNGELLLSLSYLPTAERLTAIVVETRNVISENCGLLCDIFAKVSLVEQGGKVRETFKTTIRKNNTNTVFNEVSIFKLPSRDLNNVFLNIVFYESINIIKEVRLGHICVGPKALNIKPSKEYYSYSTQHWQQMLRVLRRPVQIWHPIMK